MNLKTLINLERQLWVSNNIPEDASFQAQGHIAKMMLAKLPNVVTMIMEVINVNIQTYSGCGIFRLVFFSPLQKTVLKVP